MSTIKVLAQFNGPPIPAGVSLASVQLAITDSSGAVQSASLNGSESPTPWQTPTLTVASGAGNIVSTAVDTTGATIGSPNDTPFDTGATGGGQGNQLSGVAVTVVTP